MGPRGMCLLALAACRFSHGHLPADGASDATGSDGSGSDAVLPDAAMCATDAMSIQDGFTTSTPCSPWGGSSASLATIMQGGGMFSVSPTVDVASTHGGCAESGSMKFGPHGLFIEVTSVVAGQTAYTNLNAYAAPSGLSSTLVAKGGVLYLLGSSAQITYDATAMRWWRLRPTSSGVVGEYSADAQSWTMLGLVPGQPPDMIRLDFGAGTDNPEPTPGTAVFRNLDTCP
jgi:hypothetical protein